MTARPMRRSAEPDETRGTTGMSKYLLEVLRERVATRYYDRPEVIDEVARAILAWRIRVSS